MTATDMPEFSPDILVVKRPFLHFSEGDRITAKDIGDRADVDFLHGNGTLQPLLGKVKGARPTYASLLDEIEELSDKCTELRELHESAVRDRAAELAACEASWQKRYDEMYETLLRDLRTVTQERNDLRKGAPVLTVGATITTTPDPSVPGSTDEGVVAAAQAAIDVIPSPPSRGGRKPPPNVPQVQPMRTGGAKLNTATPSEAGGIV